MRSLIPKVKILSAGAAPLVAAFCREIKLRDTIDEMVTWDPKQCRLSPGTLIEALVINVLVARKPLYRVEEFYSEMNLNVIFGEEITADAFNDDALGRALTKLAKAHPNRVYLTLALSAIKVHNVKTRTVHADTTSISVAGEYNQTDEENDLLGITYGYSKDHRPDLKQFLYGLITTSEGIPIFGELRDGNMSDKTWNNDVLEKLQTMLPDDNGTSIYVADSALVTKDNLNLLFDKEIPFISRLPETFKISAELKEWAWSENQWQHLGSLVEKKDAAVYQVQSTVRELNGHDYRFVVVHSSSLDKKKEKSIKKMIETQRKELLEACNELAKRKFFCEADARKELEIFLAKHDTPLFELNTEIKEEQIIKRRVGRPRKDEPINYQINYRAIPSLVSVNEQFVKDLKAKASTFVLITSILDDNEFPPGDVLREYKNQTAVELSFRFLKNPVYIDGIYVKNTERVVAIGYVFLMVLLIYALLQRRVRHNLTKETKPLIIPGKRKSFSPTGTMLLEMLKPLTIITFETDSGLMHQVAENQLTEDIRRLLHLAGFSEDIYCSTNFGRSSHAV
ncbi:MAG TPA: IS1634 family transposase [Syntrophaceticus sp.]|nr:IS1634 family transposase [Syntrophaceticus sp.]